MIESAADEPSDTTCPSRASGVSDEIDLDAARDFLAALDPSARVFTFQTFDDDPKRKDKRLAQVLHGTFEERRTQLTRLNARGAGVFVTINETDGKGRRQENIVRVRAAFVDLDGSPLDPVLEWERKPHIIVESSPGKWHAYWPVVDLLLMQFEAAQKAIATRFDGDSSVCDLPRVMRLPGFIHRKAAPFRTRLVSVREGAPYAGAVFVPEGGATATVNGAKVNGHASNGYSGRRDSKWQRLNDAAMGALSAWVPALFGDRAVPTSAGGYRISSKALGRPNEEDLSIMPKGAKDFGVHDMGDKREGKRTPIDVVMEHGGKDRAQAFAWLSEQLGFVDGVTLDDFHAYMPQHTYIFAPTGETWPASSVNARVPPIPVAEVVENPQLEAPDVKGNQKPKVIQASAWLDRNKPVEQMTWAPGEPQIIRDRLITDGGWTERPGVACFNTYRPATVKRGSAGNAARWLDHVAKVYPADADHIVRYLAQRVQRPGVKINHALVLGGAPGIGKDTLLEPSKHAVGAWNFQEVSPAILFGRFNNFVKSVILRVSEAHDLGDISRYQFYERMKVYAASPPDVLRCDEKHLREHGVLNCCGVIITTNHKTDGIYLPRDDRRHYVAWADVTTEDFPAGYWNGLWAWYRDGGINDVAAYLNQLDLSAFDPKAPPPKTPAFWDIVDANRAPEDTELADIVDALGSPAAVTLEEIIMQAGNGTFRDWLRDRKNSRAIPHRMEQAGYTPVRNDSRKDGFYVIDGRRQVVYVKADLPVSERYRAAADLARKPRDDAGPRDVAPRARRGLLDDDAVYDGAAAAAAHGEPDRRDDRY